MRKTLKAEARQERTRASLRALRGAGKLPGVVYGKDAGSRAIAVPIRDLRAAAASGETELLELDLAGTGVLPVILGEVQKDPLSGEWTHVDFHQVALDQPVRSRIPLELVGTAPGTKAGGLLQIQETHLEVEGLPEALPPHLEVDIGALNIGDKLLARDLALPEGLKLHAHPDELILSVVVPRGMKEAGTGDADGEADSAAAG